MPAIIRQMQAFPAVKIGRLGVSFQYQRQGIGTHLLNLTCKMFLKDNRTGCRFVTVDAYNSESVLDFYKRYGFDFLTQQDEERKTRAMFIDLARMR
jgi:ribosomal protein S18 acetylase RimI-like enzyme